MIGLYVAGDSPLHRARPGIKLVALLVLTTLLVVLARPWAVVGGAVLVLTGVVAAGLGRRGLWALVRPLRWVVLLLVPFQVLTAGPQRAFVLVGGLVVAVAAAGLVTATTRVSDLTDTFVAAMRPCRRPLRRVGVDPDRVGLAIALVLRAVPVIGAAVGQCREARAARGLDRSVRALLVPVVVRTIRHAEGVGDALVARGLDD